MNQAVTEAFIDDVAEILFQYLKENDNGKGEVYVKSKNISELEEKLTKKKVGHALSAIEKSQEYRVSVESWGVSRSTTWRVFYSN